MACVSKIGSLYEMVTKNVIVSTTNTVFGINPRAWIALPCEGLILLKIRHRRMGYESYPTDYYGDDRYYGDGPQMRRGRGRGRGRSY